MDGFLGFLGAGLGGFFLETGLEPPPPPPPLELLLPLPLDQLDPDEALLEPLAQSSVAAGDHEDAPLELPSDQEEPPPLELPLEPPEGLDGGFGLALGLGVDLGLGLGG